jgi:hypothetical protein
MFALVLQIILGKTSCKKWLISTLNKVIYFKRTMLQGSTKTSLRYTKVLKKSSVATYDFYGSTKQSPG